MVEEASQGKAFTHKHEPRRMTHTDVFSIAPGQDIPEGFLEAIDLYLYEFAAPVICDEGHHHCFNCGGRISGMLAVLGAGVAYKWGIAHGEATCSGCGWPARGMHHPKKADGTVLFDATNLFLAYHPDAVLQVKS